MPLQKAAGYTTGLELILNACESTLQIAITDNEQACCFQEWFAPQKATEILAPALEGIFRQTGISAKDFRRIACVAGPGSFTGIRLVLATAAALRRAGKCLLGSLNYLQALATTAAKWRGWLFPGKIFVVTHARHELVHFQEFMSYGPEIPAVAVAEVRLVSPGEALKAIAGPPCLVCGSGIARNPEYFEQPVTGEGPIGAPKAILLPSLVSPGLDALRLLARHGEYYPKDVEPLYVRGCDAVDALCAEEQATFRELTTILPGQEEA